MASAQRQSGNHTGIHPRAPQRPERRYLRAARGRRHHGGASVWLALPPERHGRAPGAPRRARRWGLWGPARRGRPWRAGTGSGARPGRGRCHNGLRGGRRRRRAIRRGGLFRLARRAGGNEIGKAKSIALLSRCKVCGLFSTPQGIVQSSMVTPPRRHTLADRAYRRAVIRNT